jgi:hypothetical protein
MEALWESYQSWPLILQGIVLLCAIPVGCILIGLLVLVVGSETICTDREKPTFLDYLLELMLIGFFGSILLTAIFGGFLLLKNGFSMIRVRGWAVGPVSFIVALCATLIGFYCCVAWLAERRDRRH